MADNQDPTSDEHHPDTLIFRTQQMVLDEAQDTHVDGQALLSRQILPAQDNNNMEKDTEMRDKTSTKGNPSQQPAEGVAVPVSNIQHLIRRRERRTHRLHAEAETSSMPRDSSSRPRPDYAARNRELQSRPHGVIHYGARRREVSIPRPQRNSSNADIILQNRQDQHPTPASSQKLNPKSSTTSSSAHPRLRSICAKSIAGSDTTSRLIVPIGINTRRSGALGNISVSTAPFRFCELSLFWVDG